MSFLLTASVTFAATLLVLGGLEVAAENVAGWNAEYVANYFWSIEPDANGSEAQRKAFDLVGDPMDWSDSELCRIVDPAATGAGQSTALVGQK